MMRNTAIVMFVIVFAVAVMPLVLTVGRRLTTKAREMWDKAEKPGTEE